MNVHIYQQLILKKLIYRKNLSFSELQIQQLSSKHFNYHLKELISKDLIRKIDESYSLTNEGKDLVGRMDTENMTLEKQPKVSVMIIPYKIENDIRYILVNKRLKQPYLGKVGDYTGKIRFGETALEAAKRELFEETGLTGQLNFVRVIRKMAYKDNEFLQDNILYIFTATDLTGELISQNDDVENFWISNQDLLSHKDIYSTLPYILPVAFGENSGVDELIVEAEGY